MPTSYQDIYFKAGGLIDSYKIDQAIQESPISFFKVMYPFLLGAISELTNPMELYEYLRYRKEPVNEIQEFRSDGINTNLSLSFGVDSSLDNVFFEVLLDNARLTESIDYEYNAESNSIMLSKAPTQGSIVTVEYYYTGEIIGTNSDTINVQLTDISTQLIAVATVLKWLEKAKNRELNIKANLGAKEYNMFSPANLLKENRELYQQTYDIIVNTQNRLSWEQAFLRRKYGNHYNLFAIISPKK